MNRLRWVLVVSAVGLAFGASSRGAEPISPYGVCAHLPRGDEYSTAREELRLMHEAGIGWARPDFSWSGVEPRPGQWNFDRLDQTVQWAEEAGVRILPILDYDVAWARPAYQHLDKWTEYVRRVVTRYKDRIRYWEVWNEPNLEGFWRDKPDAANYVKLLKATHETIKQVDPELVVVMGGMAGIPWPYLEGIYKAGGGRYFDVMNVHPYRYPREPEEGRLYEDLRRLRELMAEHGDGDKPMWITEIGWPTHQGRRGISPERQSQMLARAYLLSLQAGVEVIFWYEFQAPERKPDYNEDHFGMVHRDLSPKPAYTAIEALTRARPAGATTRDRPWRAGDVFFPSWNRPDEKTGWALWTPGEGRDLTIDVKGPVVEAFDMLGRPVHIAVQNGQAKVKLDGSPLYLIGPSEVTVDVP